jgi:hypothetical protein
MAMLIVQHAFMFVLLVMVYIVQPFDAHVHAGLIGEIPESIHVIAIGFVAQILSVNHPMRMLVMSFRIQLQLRINQYVPIWWRQKIATRCKERLFAYAHGFEQQSGVRPAFVDLDAAFRTG